MYKKILIGISVLYIISILFIIGNGMYNSLDIAKTKNNFIVVYGNKVEKDGEPSKRLKARLDRSIDLFKRYNIKKIIVSGGIGETGFNEAFVMEKYLIGEGIKKENIIIDPNGNTTKLTSKNCFKILKNKEVTIIGVSQFYHLSRVKLSLKKEGFKNVLIYSPKYFEIRDLYSLIREVPAYIKYMIF